MPTRELPADPDPEGLIRDAYHMAGIAVPECRIIFLDWSLSIPEGVEPCLALRALIERHGRDAPDHPMTRILAENLATAPAPRRRRARRATSTAA
ncbi:hypothetical protein [Poseidonocella sp. HB161398]|uniref:hypothetical protein n=1 Tax=Poseidonocella sp. HB161398 TaxID=2320855 RepID=UPI001109777B|nr:hypothetical protein [Poseidonocella sp. HB161398]